MSILSVMGIRRWCCIALCSAVWTFQLFPQSVTKYTRTPISVEYQSIVGGSIGPRGDNAATDVQLPFKFAFAGADYTVVRICTNGWLELGSSEYQQSESVTGDNHALFTAAPPNNVLAPWWDDLNVGEGVIKYKTTGSMPSRVFTVEWNGVYSNPNPATTRVITFQAALFEADGTIEFRYGPRSGIPSVLEHASIGLADAAGTGFMDGSTGDTLAPGRTSLGTDADWPMNGLRFTPQPLIRVVYPNGGEVLSTGFAVPVSWYSQSVSRVKYEYTTNGGTTWIVPSQGPTSAAARSITWTTPATSSEQMRVRIRDYDNSSIVDESDGLFTVLLPPRITVSPNTITETMNWGERREKPVTVENRGGAWLFWRLTGWEATIAGRKIGIVHPESSQILTNALRLRGADVRELPLPIPADAMENVRSLDILIFDDGIGQCSDVFVRDTLREIVSQGTSILLQGDDPATFGKLDSLLAGTGLALARAERRSSHTFLAPQHILAHPVTNGLDTIVSAECETYCVVEPPAQAVVADGQHAYMGAGVLGAGRIFVMGNELTRDDLIGEPGTRQFVTQVVDWLAGVRGFVTLSSSGGLVQGGGSQPLTVALADSVLRAGTWRDAALIASNDPSNSLLKLAVTVTVIAKPEIDVDTVLNFGSCIAGFGRLCTLTVHSAGGAALAVVQITMSDARFSVEQSGFSLPPQSAKLLPVSFNPGPLDTGWFSAQMTIISNDSDESVTTVGLQARGQFPPRLSVGVDTLEMLVVRGDSAGRTLTIANTGRGDLHFTLIPRPPVDPYGPAANPPQGLNRRSGSSPDALRSADPAGPRGKNLSPAGLKSAMSAGNQANRQLGRAPNSGESRVPRRVETSGILPGITAACFIVRGDGWSFCRIDLSDPGTLMSSIPMEGSIYAGDVGGMGDFYFIDRDRNHLLRIGLAGGGPEDIGPSLPMDGGSWTGMSYDATTGKMFASCTDGSQSMLYTIDLETGRPAPIGEITNAPVIITIAVSPDGRLYGVDIVSDVLLRIDASTGEGTVVGGIGFDANFAQASDFDPATGTYYLAAFNDDADRAELRVGNLDSGRTTLVGVLPAGSDVTAFGILDRFETEPRAGTIGPGDSMNINVKAKVNGALVCRLLGEIAISGDDPERAGNPVLVPLRANVASERRISLSTDTVNFGSQYTGFGMTETLMVRNAGSGMLSIQDVRFNSPVFFADQTVFPVSGCGVVPLVLTYLAGDAGSFAGTLTIVSDDPQHPEIRIPVVGRSSYPPSVRTSEDSLEVSMSDMDTCARNFMLFNDGRGDLVFHLSVDFPRGGDPPRAEERSPSSQNRNAEGSPLNATHVTRHGGPDSAGYTWMDSDEPGSPRFDWTDISFVGIELTESDWRRTGSFSALDEGYCAVRFPFRFYGADADTVFFSTNGFLSVLPVTVNAWTPQYLPSPGLPNGVVAGLWQDLDLERGGRVLYYEDVANGRLIVQYDSVALYGYEGHYTFQFLLTNGGEIAMQYLDVMSGQPSAVSVGIENQSGSDGLQVVYYDSYLHDRLSLRFIPKQTPIDLSVLNGILSPGDSAGISLRAEIGDFSAGTTGLVLQVSTNDPGHPRLSIPIAVRAQGITPQPGWNLVSLPWDTKSRMRSELFPTSGSRAFTYKGTYVVRESISAGAGYWLKFASSAIPGIAGSARVKDTLHLAAGWNMIGSIAVPVPVSTIGSEPGGAVTSAFFGYGGSYVVSQTIEPGKGYWVRLNAPATLILSANPGAAELSSIRIVPGEELPPDPPQDGEVPLNPPREIPTAFSLEQNYPNPFNPSTHFEFRIAKVEFVTLGIYNLLGQEVATLVNEAKTPGVYGVRWDARSLPSGVYFYRLRAGAFVDTKKFVLMR